MTINIYGQITSYDRISGLPLLWEVDAWVTGLEYGVWSLTVLLLHMTSRYVINLLTNV